jgi:recombination protein RecA
MSVAAVLREPTSRPNQAPAAPESAPFLKTIAGVKVGHPAVDLNEGPRPLQVHFGGLDEVLPDGGLPRGAVVEIAAPYGLARATSIALAACSSAQAEAKLRGGEGAAGAWCAWIEPADEVASSKVPFTMGPQAAPNPAPAKPAHGPPPTSLFAPAVARAGIDLSRFLVIRPTADAIAKVAARAAQSRVFSVIVIDLAGVPGRRPETRLDRWVNPVRRLAMAVEGVESTVVLLTDALAPRSLPLPVALRLEVERATSDRLRLTVAKDRRGRVAPPKPVVVPHAALG